MKSCKTCITPCETRNDLVKAMEIILKDKQGRELCGNWHEVYAKMCDRYQKQGWMDRWFNKGVK